MKTSDSFESFVGTYAFNPGQSGIWIGYDNENTFSAKTKYATSEKKLGGVALVYVNSDDFRGVCTGYSYPLLRVVVSGTEQVQPAAVISGALTT